MRKIKSMIDSVLTALAWIVVITVLVGFGSIILWMIYQVIKMAWMIILGLVCTLVLFLWAADKLGLL